MKSKTIPNDRPLIRVGSYEALLRRKLEDFLFRFKWYQRYRNTEILELLEVVAETVEENNLTCFITGGIAYDALRGKLTRLHKDIDIALLARHRSALLAAFEKAGLRLYEKDPYCIVGQTKNGKSHVDFFVWKETAEETAEMIYGGVLIRIPRIFISCGQEACLNNVSILLAGNEYLRSIMPFIDSEKDRSFVSKLETRPFKSHEPRIETVMRKVDLRVLEYGFIRES